MILIIGRTVQLLVEGQNREGIGSVIILHQNMEAIIAQMMAQLMCKRENAMKTHVPVREYDK